MPADPPAPTLVRRLDPWRKARAPAFCEFVWLVTYCGMVWSRHEHPGSCGYHSLMIAMDPRGG
jgi:hypothetical protein